jgi:[ribosomal protein S18]-alanine N-acetyltransferase
MSCHLEPVSRAAATLLSALHEICFPDEPWSASAIAEVMGIPGFFGQLALKEERPAGFVLALDLGGECELLSLGVVPEQRRSGMGSMLLHSICLVARSRGAGSIVLEVAEDNAAARGLYSKLGFAEVGRRLHYYARAQNVINALILRRALITDEPAT